ncbi:unnamed protein product [Linum trigynum]|uniref:Retrotransposon gag domain-containing protein n=1 Tax=Linum trigynum TaxID=586398 RepID=A0AAV2CHK6_9ROSI
MYGTWDRVNGIVVCWLRNSVSDDIVPSLRNIRVASEAWNYLKSKFSQGDSVRIANLQDKIDLIKQGTLTVRQYHTDLKVLWDEQESYFPIPYCDCASKTYETVIMYRDRAKVIKFLLGLNEKYQQVKTQMLMLDPLPDLDNIYRSVVQLERQLNGAGGNTGKSEEAIALATALVASKSQSGQGRDKFHKEATQDTGLFCRYCKKDNHVIQECWKLKRKNKEGGGTNFVGSVDVNAVERNGPGGGTPTYSPTSPGSSSDNQSAFSGFTTEELNRLKALLQTPQ